MIWISEFFFCVGTMTITGSIAGLLFLLFRRKLMHARSGIVIWFLKMIILLYLLPIAYITVLLTRKQVSLGDLVNVGYFGVSMRPALVKALGVIGCVWLVGLAVEVYKQYSEHRRFKRVIRDNLPAADERWTRLVEEECARHHMKTVPIYENLCISSPMTVNIFKPIIMVPNMDITEQQMHMVIEHEVNHIRVHDIFWKRIALWAALLHWFNPIAYYLVEWLNLEQEIECDIYVCGTTKHYTPKEYFSFIVSLVEVKKNLLFASKFFERGDTLKRRVEAMKERRKHGPASKVMVLVCCMALVLVSAIPACAMAEGLVSYDEKVQRVTEQAVAAEETDAEQLEEFSYIETETVNEVDLSSGVAAYSSIVNMDLTAAANTRYSWKMQSMEVGDQVGITISCDNPDVVFWIGIKNVYGGEVRYVQGTGTLSHTFTINEAGYYRAFAENRSDVDARFAGSAVYPY